MRARNARRTGASRIRPALSATVLAALVLVARAAPVVAQTPQPTSAERCHVVAGVEVGCDERRSSDGDDEALPWLLFGVVLLPVAFLVIASVLAVPLLAGARGLRRRWVRWRRSS